VAGRAVIASGPVIQVAWVVEDLDAIEELLTRQYGLKSWVRMDGIRFGPDTCSYRGKPADFTADISMAYAGDLQLELIRPVSGESIYTEFLATAGPGLHHICFETDDMDRAVAHAEAAGIEVVQRGSMAGGLMEFAYFDGAAAGAPYIELARLSPEMQALYDDIKARTT
jgi:catechol 2,3-dioxygenase-like lactoylglutathione lyase family enzyme